MKTIKFLITALALMTLFTACSDDEFGLDYELVNAEQLRAEPGSELSFGIKFSDDSGVQQVIIESEDLDLNYLENVESRPEVLTRDFEVVIPSTAEEGDVYEIELEFSDIDGNSLVDTISVQII
jgi:hypothetical protein